MGWGKSLSVHFNWMGHRNSPDRDAVAPPPAIAENTPAETTALGVACGIVCADSLVGWPAFAKGRGLNPKIFI